jgi:uncharacterized protein YjbI with pentapeptide repeats
VTSRLARWWRSHRGAILVAGAVAAALVIAAAFIWPITDLIAVHDVGRIAGSQRATQLQTAREAVRTQLLTLAAGVFVAGALWFTAQNYRLSRQGQVTDRYTKAIEQLGSDKLDVRIGGIYALERIARDSARDHPTVIEVLSAFIREHSREHWEPPPDQVHFSPSGRMTRPDVQAAVTVIGRRTAEHDRQPVNLHDAIVRRADLTFANFSGARLSGAELSGADLSRADLSRADLFVSGLVETTLTGATLTGANLLGARAGRAWLDGADLTGANLWGTFLMKARLTGANLTGANLHGVILNDANLTEANLTGADLLTTSGRIEGAIFTGAILGEGQPVPEGWLRDRDSGRLRPASRDANDTG